MSNEWESIDDGAFTLPPPGPEDAARLAASVGLGITGAGGAILSLILCVLTLFSIASAVGFLFAMGSSGTSSNTTLYLFSGVSALFSAFQIVPFSLGVFTVYAAYSLRTGGSARVVRLGAVAAVLGPALLTGSTLFASLVFGCLSIVLTLFGTTLIAVGLLSAISATVAVHNARTAWEDQTSERTED